MPASLKPLPLSTPRAMVRYKQVDSVKVRADTVRKADPSPFTDIMKPAPWSIIAFPKSRRPSTGNLSTSVSNVK
jgi:hypothetical protein